MTGREELGRHFGIGFGDYGDNHVRLALIENEERTRQAPRGIKAMLAKGVVPA